MSCVINSLHAPHGGIAFPSLPIAMTRRIAFSPFETMPLEPDECKNIEYTGAQYIVCGEPDDFSEIVIDSVTIHIAKFHPSTELNTKHFVIEISPIRLKWVV